MTYNAEYKSKSLESDFYTYIHAYRISVLYMSKFQPHL